MNCEDLNFNFFFSDLKSVASFKFFLHMYLDSLTLTLS